LLSDGDVVQRPKLSKRKLHNWYEPWEMVVFKKAGNQYFEALMNLKYGGLSFKRQDNGEVGFTLQEKCAVLIRCKAHKDYGIACSVSNPSMVLDVFDCSQHAAEGGKKDAEYLVKTMLPKLKEIDPQRELIDLITFDGAGNVQNAAKLLTLHFPRASVGPAIEHVVSLVFDKAMRIRPINELCRIAKMVSKVLLCFVATLY
jgi:hypothetical protein